LTIPIEDVAATAVREVGGQVVRVRDVAQVQWAEQKAQHLTRFNGKRAVFVTVAQKDGADVGKVTRGVETQLAEFEKTLPGGVKLERGFFQARNVEHRLGNLFRDFGIALGLVIITLLPLGLRASGVVMVSIPLSLLIGLAALQALGFTVNQLSIAGFVLSLGLLVDDSIVVTADASARLERALDLPPSYNWSLGGQAEAQSESFSGLGAAILVAIFGILAVLVLEFGKFKTALVVAGVIPLGLFGAVAALWLTGNSLSFTATIGLIALIGIEVKNSILLVDFTEQLRRQGVGLREAIERAGEVRFLPVLLTSVTAIFGLLPLALERSGLYSPLAIAIMGGLVTSTFLSRVATPVTYWLLSRGERDEATA